MELFGKVVAPNRGPLNLNGNEELLVNVKGNRVTLSTGLLSKLSWADKAIGFGYDPARELGSATVYIYGVDNVEEGCKVGKSGTVTNKFHTDKIASAFALDINNSNRFKLDVNVDSPVTHPSGVVLYPVTFLSTLADLTRTVGSADNGQEEDQESEELPAALVLDEVAISQE